MGLAQKYAKYFQQGKNFGKQDQKRLDNFLEATEGLDRDVAIKALGGMKFGKNDMRRYEELMKQQNKKKDMPKEDTVSIQPVDPPKEDTFSIQPVNPPDDGVVSIQPVNPPKEDTFFIQPVDPPKEDTVSIQPVDPPSGVPGDGLSDDSGSSKDAQVDLKTFQSLLGRLERSKKRQQRQKSVEGRRDIYAGGLASMMRNF